MVEAKGDAGKFLDINALTQKPRKSKIEIDELLAAAD